MDLGLVELLLAACLFIAPTPNLPSSRWLGERFGAAQLDTPARSGLLAGRPPRGQNDAGETVCACFNVGRTRIEQAIRGKGLRPPKPSAPACKPTPTAGGV